MPNASSIRLSKALQQQIYATLIKNFGLVPVILFGSRADPQRVGGDIDIALDSHYSRAEFRQRRAHLLADLLRQDLDLPLDLVQLCDASPLLSREIAEHGVLLTPLEPVSTVQPTLHHFQR
ncbi:MAG: hypothetical protein HQL49_09035 [Gammaproteobacteria bacterium]|nr:hypothetical protein [Gammaproteobacteria bacterium]